MRIFEDGKLVGVLDEHSLALSESTSARLTALIRELSQNGIERMLPQEGPLEAGQACGSVIVTVPFEPKYLHAFVNDIEAAGFDVEEID